MSGRCTSCAARAFGCTTRRPFVLRRVQQRRACRARSSDGGAAIQRQTAILATHTRYLHEPYSTTRSAHGALPAHLDTCMFVNSGSEANDVAWRIAQSATGHYGRLVMQHAYHGITDAVAALTPSLGKPRDPRVADAWPHPPGELRRAN
jgi:hypothetical protein